MKNTIKLLGIVALALVFGMTVFGCKDKSDDNGNGNNNESSASTFTLTDIPSRFNGKYALMKSGDIGGALDVDGIINDSVFLLGLISNGRVSLPVWITDMNSDNWERYYGNDTVGLKVEFYNSNRKNHDDDESGVYFNTVTFKNGSATKSFNDGRFYYYENPDTDYYRVQGAWFGEDGTIINFGGYYDFTVFVDTSYMINIIDGTYEIDDRNIKLTITEINGILFDLEYRFYSKNELETSLRGMGSSEKEIAEALEMFTPQTTAYSINGNKLTIIEGWFQGTYTRY
jgi:hypothetical protein